MKYLFILQLYLIVVLPVYAEYNSVVPLEVTGYIIPKSKQTTDIDIIIKDILRGDVGRCPLTSPTQVFLPCIKLDGNLYIIWF